MSWVQRNSVWTSFIACRQTETLSHSTSKYNTVQEILVLLWVISLGEGHVMLTRGHATLWVNVLLSVKLILVLELCYIALKVRLHFTKVKARRRTCDLGRCSHNLHKPFQVYSIISDIKNSSNWVQRWCYCMTSWRRLIWESCCQGIGRFMFVHSRRPQKSLFSDKKTATVS